MINRYAVVALGAALAVAFGGSARAASLTGGVGFTQAENTNVIIAPGSDINTATSFSFTAEATSARTGDFTALSTGQTLGTVMLTYSGPGTGTFVFGGTPAFGQIVTSNVIELSNNVASRSFLIEGALTPGTAFPSGSMVTPVAINVVFSQVTSNSPVISAAGTLAAVPEPASMAMVGTAALAGLALASRRLRRSA